jgi:hypothetical protein
VNTIEEVTKNKLKKHEGKREEEEGKVIVG